MQAEERRNRMIAELHAWQDLMDSAPFTEMRLQWEIWRAAADEELHNAHAALPHSITAAQTAYRAFDAVLRYGPERVEELQRRLAQD